MKGKVCIITGATRGIGRAVLDRFVSRGARVIGTYVNSRSEAENMCIDMPIEMHRLDMGNASAIKKLIEHVRQVYGRVDVLVNNAGICERVQWPKISRTITDKTMRVNVEAPLLMVTYMRDLFSLGSSVVNVGSVQAHITTAQPHYASSKAALHAQTKFLARELAPRVRVNNIAPGYVDTDLTKGVDREHMSKQIPIRRFGTVGEVAIAVEFLADSDLSGYITGETLNVNGGLFMP